MVSVPTSRLSSGAVTGALDGLCWPWALLAVVTGSSGGWTMLSAVTRLLLGTPGGRQQQQRSVRVSSSQGTFTGRVCCRKRAQEVGLRGVMGSGTSVVRQLDRDR